MRHIKTDSIVTRLASSEDQNFPIAMTADMHPKRKYKAVAGNWSSTIDIDVVGGCSDIMLAGTNAVSAAITVTDPNEISWGDSDTWGDGDTWANTGIGSTTADMTQRSRSQALWLTLSPVVEIPCSVAMVLICPPAETLEIGIIRAGVAETYGEKNPKYGLSENRIDFSIVDENSNGSFYMKKRDIVREFSISALLTRGNAWELADNYDELGMEPTAWRLTDASNSEWVVFGRFAEPPQIQHTYLQHSEVAFNIQEVI